MKKNIGPLDKGIRIFAALALILDGMFIPMSPGWRTGVWIVAGITLLNAFISF
jgi:hypothetical protein